MIKYRSPSLCEDADALLWVLGGGLWMPEAQALVALRKDIDREPHKIKGLLLDAGLSRDFLGSVGKDEEAAVKAFCNQNAENALKTKPKVSSSNIRLSESLRMVRLLLSYCPCRLSNHTQLSQSGFSERAFALCRIWPWFREVYRN